MRCLFSPDGRSLVTFRDLEQEFPGKVQVGLTASNVLRRPFSAQFQDFVLFDDKDKLAEQFGKGP